MKNTPFDFGLALNQINQTINNLPLEHSPVELYDPVRYFLGLGEKGCDQC